jgi:hypothetical protein
MNAALINIPMVTITMTEREAILLRAWVGASNYEVALSTMKASVIMADRYTPPDKKEVELFLGSVMKAVDSLM